MSEEQGKWSKHLEAIDAEGIGVQAYARREGLSAASLYYWRRRLKSGQHATQIKAGGQLVAVELDDRSDAVGCTLRIAPGVGLELMQLPSAAWLAQFAAALSGQVR